MAKKPVIKNCKHETIKITEVIEAMHQRIFEGNDFYCNNEFGGRVRVEYECIKCGISSNFDPHNPPEFIAEKVKLLQDENLL